MRRHKDDVYAATLIDKAAVVWKTDRESYPGWLLCPTAARATLQHGTTQVPWVTDSRLVTLSHERKSAVLYELAWRLKTSLSPVDKATVVMLVQIGDPNISCGLKRHQQIEVAIQILELARTLKEEDIFLRFCGVLEGFADSNPEVASAIAYQRALWARDCLDLEAIPKLIAEIKITNDPIWHLRQRSCCVR